MQQRYTRVGAILLACVLTSSTSFGQCPGIPTPGTQSVDGTIKTSDGSCQASDGDYVKYAGSFRLDTLAHADGTCTVMVPSCFPLPCYCIRAQTTPNPQLRAIDNVKVNEYNDSPYSPFFKGMMFAKSQGQKVNTVTLDTTQSGTTGPLLWTPSNVGTSRLDFVSLIYTTSCNIQPGSQTHSYSLNVTKCGPRFNSDPALTGDPITRLTPTEISIYVPSAFTSVVTAADSAIPDWNNNLSGTGVHLTRVTAPCDTNQPSCVTIVDAASDCSSWSADWDTTGKMSQNIKIIFPISSDPTFNQRKPRMLQLLFAHEIGHLLGLAEQDATCVLYDSVMASGLRCSDDPLEYNVTKTDKTLVQQTSYGTSSRRGCGF